MVESTIAKVRMKANRVESEEGVSIDINQYGNDGFAWVEMGSSYGKANLKMLSWLISRDDMVVNTVNTANTEKEGVDLSINITIEKR